MKVKILIKTPAQLAGLVRVSHETGFSFYLEQDEEFDSILFRTIDEGLLDPAWITCDTVQQAISDLYNRLRSDSDGDSDLKEQQDVVNDFMKSVKAHREQMLDDELRKPTEHFKSYCGSEWLTPKGLISKRSAWGFVESQVRVRRLSERNGTLELDEGLRGMLGIAQDTVRVSDLPGYLDRLFQ